MSKKKTPRLRTVEKVKPPFPLNGFPQDFGYNIGREIVYLLATKRKAILEGQEWEEIFANCIGAKWKPSNIGLDDVVLKTCAWGAKTVKAKNPSKQNLVRLISGRNSPVYSFGESEVSNVEPNHLGEQVVSIWNERVSLIRKLYKHVRTVVLVKSDDLTEVLVFEFDTVRYEPELYSWKWNKRGNLEGFYKQSGAHCFTWQPHGSQFTILETIPDNCLIIKINPPEKLNKESVLKNLGFNKNWVTISKKMPDNFSK